MASKTKEIQKELADEISKPPSAEDFYEAVVKRAEEYKKFVENQKKALE
jgi:hypothetical protein